MRIRKISIREQDEETWQRAQQVAEAEYLPFSRFLTKVLAEYLKAREPNGSPREES